MNPGGVHDARIEATGTGVVATGDVQQQGQYVAGRDLYIYEGLTYPRLAYRQEIGPVVNFYTDVFVGRKSELGRLAEFAAQPGSGYLLIEALPGFGKSALVAQLIHQHEARQWARHAPNLIYFFIREDGKRHTPEAFCSAVNSQLLDLLDEQGGVPPDLERQRGQLLHLWMRAVEKARADQPLLLVVDGLDEIALGEVTIPDLFPGQLGPHVHVVVTSRPNPAPLQQVALEHPLRHAEVMHLNSLRIGDVEQLLYRQGGSTGVVSKLAQRVLKVTNGEPLLARFIAQDVVAGGEQVLARLEQHAPAGVKGYFRLQFDQLDMRAEGDTAWDVLGLLLVAHGPMTIAELAGALGAPSRHVRKAIEPIRRFLLGSDRLELMHVELRAVVAEAFTAPERQNYRRRLLDWCSTFAQAGWPEDTPDYVLEYEAAHMRESNDNEGLYRLLDRRRMELKAARTHSHRSFARDALLAIDAAGTEEPPNLIQEARGALIYSRLGSLAENVPPEILGVLARAGQVARAEGHASLLTDPKKRSNAYRLIAAELLHAGDILKVDGVVDQAHEAALAITENGQRADALREVARLLTKAGQLDQALLVVRAITEDWQQAWALREVAAALVEAGQHERAVSVADQALAAAQAITEDVQRASALREMAGVLAEAGQVDQALVAARSITGGVERASALREVARVLATAGQVDQALVAARAITGDLDRVSALHEVVGVLVEAGQHEQAVSVADQILAVARAASHSQFFATLGHEVSMLFLLGREEEMLAISREVLEIETWWMDHRT